MPEEEKEAWYCLQTLPKKERIAGMHIRNEVEVEAFCPQISYEKKTRVGKKRFTEALFPGYIFVRCDIGQKLRHLLAQNGVRGVVRYGNFIPVIPPDFIADLEKRLGGEKHEAEAPAIQEGDEVLITEGPFANWSAIVTGKVSARERVSLLLEFLGQQLNVDVPTKSLMKKGHEPKKNLFDDKK